jgi:hypothetical protein
LAHRIDQEDDAAFYQRLLRLAGLSGILFLLVLPFRQIHFQHHGLSPAIDAFIDGARAAAANGEAGAYDKHVKGFLDLAFTDMPRIPLYQPYVNVAMQKNITGYQYWFHRRLDYRSFEKG